ncbi:hypothetical protein [Bradyrhizobium glycinis]|uniref:hypothetical protein n=1 Tax=Bradyrhizobium glycinis TaxID=2751812 RepID=UPI0018D83416|nr:hypothetical protein [Bradyrhizobium glycinis]MBH5370484.1 hypothetical protein [Bradyrhizobium glycinis]
MNNSESGARLEVRLQDVDLSALKTPFHSQWTYGAEWSKARILASDRTDARIEQPAEESEELKFEVHYRSWFGIAYFGLGRKASAEQSLPNLLATLESTVSGRMSAAAAAKLVIGDKLSECVFSECVFGVANAWLENPRYTVAPAKPLSLAALEKSAMDVHGIFSTGTANPIMCELIDPRLDVWLAIQISETGHDQHFVSSELARRVFTQVFLRK